MEVTYLPVDWKTYISQAENLAATLLSRDRGINGIIAISRGGLTFGHLLSDLIRVPIATISIPSYTDIQSQGELKITGKLHAPIKGKRILLVDDVSDSGKTFLRAISYLQKLHPLSVTTMSIYYKPHSVYRPDYFAETTSKWILFPYEPTEMILAIIRKLQKHGKTKAQIQAALESLNYTAKQIKFVRKYHLP